MTATAELPRRVAEVAEGCCRRCDNERATLLLSETRGLLSARKRAELVSLLFFPISEHAVLVRDSTQRKQDADTE